MYILAEKGGFDQWFELSGPGLVYPVNSRLHRSWAYSAMLASGVVGVLYGY